MAFKVKVSVPNSEPMEVEAKRFTIYLGNVAHQFCYHESISRTNEWTVTDIASGKKVAGFTSIDLAFLHHDKVIAAKNAIEKVVNRVGLPRFESVLRGA